MIILTKAEVINAFQCAYMEYHDIDNRDEQKMTEMIALQNQLLDKLDDECLKNPHYERRTIL